MKTFLVRFFAVTFVMPVLTGICENSTSLEKAIADAINTLNNHAASRISESQDRTKADSCWTDPRTGVIYDLSAKAVVRCPREQTGSIRIRDGIARICPRAFDGCTNLTEVIIPSSVTNSLCDGFFFRGCSSLTSIVYAAEHPYFASRDGIVYTKDLRTLVCCPSGKISIDEKMIPEGVNVIGCHAFFECSSLREFQIPINVTNIGNCAFRSCSRLTSIGIPEGVSSIGVLAFEGCRRLVEIHLPKSINKAYAIFEKWGGPERILTAHGDAARILSLLYSRNGGAPVYSPRYRVSQGNMLVRKVPENSHRWRDVEKGLAWTYQIENGAADLKGIEFLDGSVNKVEIPASLGDVPLVAVDCSLPCRNPYLIRGVVLAPVLIPASVTNISDKCAESGAMVEVHPENRRFKSVHGSLYDVEMTKLYSYSRTNSVWKVPSSVRVIGAFASCWNSELTAVKLHQGVTEIGYNAFAGCIRLRKFSITSSVTNISTTAFHGCRALRGVTVIEKDGRASFVSIDDIARWGFGAVQNRSAGSTRRSSRRLPPNRNFQR